MTAFVFLIPLGGNGLNALYYWLAFYNAMFITLYQEGFTMLEKIGEAAFSSVGFLENQLVYQPCSEGLVPLVPLQH